MTLSDRTYSNDNKTTKQLVKEIHYTDKLIANVHKAMIKLYDHEDQTNSQRRREIIETNAEFFRDLDQSREMPY